MARARALAALAAPLALLACTGRIGDSAEPAPRAGLPPAGHPAPAAPAPAPALAPVAVAPGATATASADPAAAPSCQPAAAVRVPLRRLTRREYDNTVRDLLGDTTAPARGFVADERSGLFESNGVAPLGPSHAVAYAEAAAALARDAVTRRLTTVAPCAGKMADADCARLFVAGFGRRAYRRPLADAEQARALALYSQARADGGDFAEGVRLVIESMLQSPHFLMHVERGRPQPGATVLRLAPHELAARLSYFIWSSMPDAALSEAADAGKLESPEQIEAQATRLLAAPRARASLLATFVQWLGLDGAAAISKNTETFPAWRPEQNAALLREGEAFLSSVLWDEDGRLATLLTAPFTFVEAATAPLYGLPVPPGSARVRVTLNPDQRGGVLTQLAFLQINAHAAQSSPVRRGQAVRDRLLCAPVPPPPGVDSNPPPPTPGASLRDRLQRHAEDPACGGCHRLLDGIGFAFEAYDALGRHRTSDNGRPVDTRGELLGVAGVPAAFDGVPALGRLLAASAAAETCLLERLLERALGVAAAEWRASPSAPSLRRGRAGAT